MAEYKSMNEDDLMDEDSDENFPSSSIRNTQHGAFSSSYGDPSLAGQSYRFPYDSVPLSNLRSSSVFYERQGQALQGPIVHEGFIPRAAQSDHDEYDEEEYEDDRSMSGVANSRYPDIPSPEPVGPAYETTELQNDMRFDRSALLQSVLDANNQNVDPDFAISDEEPENSPEEMSDSDQESVMRGEGRRGAARGRGRGRGRPRGSRARGRVPRGEGARGGRKGKRGPRAVAEPSREFKEYQREAVKAHLEERYQDALIAARKAVETNPEIFAAHSLLSHALENLGRKEESVLALWSGAHTQRDPRIWWSVIDEFEKLPGKDRNETLDRVYACCSEIIRLDSSDYEARVQRLNIQLEREQWGKAKRECITILKIRPHDVEIMRQLATLCMRTDEPEQALRYYEETIDHFINSTSPEDGEFKWSLLNEYIDILDSAKRYQVGIHKLRSLARWLLGRHEESFWDDQPDDREWDVEDFPRRVNVKEFVPGKYSQETYGDGLPLELRVKLGLFRMRMEPHQRDEAFRHFNLLGPEDHSTNAILFEYSDLFLVVADALRKFGFHEDALRFYEPLQGVPEIIDNSYTLLHHSLATCYKAVNRPYDAERCYKNIIDHGSQHVGNNRRGEEFNRRLEARIELAKLYEELGMHESALPIVKELMKMGKRDMVIKANLRQREPTPEYDKDGAENGDEQTRDGASVTRKPKKAPSQSKRRKERVAAQSEAQETPTRAYVPTNRTRELYATVKSLHDAVLEGDREATQEWMRAADLMIQDFRSMKPLYPRRDKHLKFTGFHNKRFKDPESKTLNEINAMAKRLQPFAEGDEEFSAMDVDDAPPDEFRDIPFDEWCDIFCLYALNLAKAGDSERCWDILESASQANVFFHHDHRITFISTTWLACALLLGDEFMIYTQSRWFVKRFPYATQAYRLYSLTNRLHTGPRTWYNSGPSQKYILRQIKAMDFAVLDAAGRNAYKFTEQEVAGWTESGTTNGNPHGIAELDPALLALYAHVLATGGAYPSALNYYFRAYVLCPEDVMVNLSIATCFVQHALKRQSENRQFQIQQGLVFLMRYYELRTKGGKALHEQEAEFNVARVWHMLGLMHLALPAYERCLELSGRVREEQMQGGGDEDGGGEGVEDFAKEAAFAIQTILATNGDMEGARRVTEEWLVI